MGAKHRHSPKWSEQRNQPILWASRDRFQSHAFDMSTIPFIQIYVTMWCWRKGIYKVTPCFVGNSDWKPKGTTRLPAATLYHSLGSWKMLESNVMVRLCWGDYVLLGDGRWWLWHSPDTSWWSFDLMDALLASGLFGMGKYGMWNVSIHCKSELAPVDEELRVLFRASVDAGSYGHGFWEGAPFQEAMSVWYFNFLGLVCGDIFLSAHPVFSLGLVDDAITISRNHYSLSLALLSSARFPY